MKYINVFLFVFLISLAFSGYWEKGVDSIIGTVPVVFSGSIVVGTYNGAVIALNVKNGVQTWKKAGLGEEISTIELFKNRLLVAMENGTVYVLKNYGEIEAKEDLKAQVYGVTVYEDKAYFTTKKGIAVYDGNAVEWIYEEEDSYGIPMVYGNRLIVGKGDKLLSLTFDGEVKWETEVGPFWNNKPVVYANIIYVGSVNHYLYAIDAESGEKKWMFGSDGAITSSAIVYGGTVYFGSNDNYLYAVDAADGTVKWKGKTNGGIFSTPVITDIGKENVVVIGSSDSYVYGFKRTTGELVWGYLTAGAISEIELYEGEIVVVSDYYLYLLSTERSCVITEPSDRTAIGYKEIEIKGKVFSQYSDAEALLSVNDGAWENAGADENGSFTYILDPNIYSFGPIEVKCKASDSTGQSQTATLTLIRSADFVKPEFELEYPEKVKEGEKVVIEVFDEETGEHVNNFNYKLYGESLKGNEGITFTAAEAGEIEIAFSKTGYESKKITIIVEKDYTIYIVGIVILLIVVVVVWFKFLRKKHVEE